MKRHLQSIAITVVEAATLGIATMRDNPIPGLNVRFREALARGLKHEDAALEGVLCDYQDRCKFFRSALKRIADTPIRDATEATETMKSIARVALAESEGGP